MGCHRSRRRFTPVTPSELTAYASKLASPGGPALPTFEDIPATKRDIRIEPRPNVGQDAPPDEDWDWFLQNFDIQRLDDLTDDDTWQLIRFFNLEYVVFGGPRDIIGDEGSSDDEDPEEHPPASPQQNDPTDSTEDTDDTESTTTMDDVNDYVWRQQCRPTHIKPFTCGTLKCSATPFLEKASTGLTLPPPKKATPTQALTKDTPLIQEALQSMVDNGILEKTSSLPFYFRFFLVGKPDG